MDFKKVVKSIMDDENLKSKLENLQSFEEVYKFFLSNGYEGTKQELKKNLFGRSKTNYEVPEKELDQVAGGASGRQTLAACASIMMVLGVAPIGTPAKATSFDNGLSIAKMAEKDTTNQGSKDYDADQSEERLGYIFEHYFKNQQAAKDTITHFFEGYTEEKRYAADGQTGLPAPNLLILNGSHEVDTMSIAKNLSQIITSTDPFIISASQILKASNGGSNSVQDALFYGTHGIGGKDSLISFLKATKGSARVVIINRWDQLYSQDVNGNYPETHSFDEIIRNIFCNNIKDDSGNPVDLNGVVFIFTGNESEASLQGRIAVDPKTSELVEALVDENGSPILDNYGHQIYDKPKKSGQTLIPHDKSLMEHLLGHICYFNSDNE